MCFSWFHSAEYIPNNCHDYSNTSIFFTNFSNNITFLMNFTVNLQLDGFITHDLNGFPNVCYKRKHYMTHRKWSALLFNHFVSDISKYLYMSDINFPCRTSCTHISVKFQSLNHYLIVCSLHPVLSFNINSFHFSRLINH